MIQITPHTDRGGTRGYDSDAERETDKQTLRAGGFDHFTDYRDTAAEFALSYGIQCWDDNAPKRTPPQHGWMVRHPGYDLMY